MKGFKSTSGPESASLAASQNFWPGYTNNLPPTLTNSNKLAAPMLTQVVHLGALICRAAAWANMASSKRGGGEVGRRSTKEIEIQLEGDA